MVAIARPIEQVAACSPFTTQAAAQGYPATMFGFTPEQKEYWQEPGLPWLPLNGEMPLGYIGLQLLRIPLQIGSSTRMAPRFPKGCEVNVAPVYEKKNLVVGKVYLYVYTDSETGKEACDLGRLSHIGGNYLKVTFDNDPVPAMWLLRDDEQQAVWDVYEVTHYAIYPGEDEFLGGGHE